MRLYSYVVRYDIGFAPNPFHGWCTLATCKQDIRIKARVDDWTVGTGSRTTGLGDYARADVILWMVENQKQEMARLGLPFDDLWGRPLQAIDCQGVFCETDKYCREAAPELASARKRIKARSTWPGIR